MTISHFRPETSLDADSNGFPALDEAAFPSPHPTAGYPDQPLEVFRLELPAEWDMYSDRVFMSWQAGGRKYFIQARDEVGIVSAEVFEPREGLAPAHRPFTEAEIDRLRGEVVQNFPHSVELRDALARNNGLRAFLHLPPEEHEIRRE